MGAEFVLHVPDEYDYRYSTADCKDAVIEIICKSFCDHMKSKLAFFFRDEISLENYCTTKGDKKKGISRMPTDNGLLLDYNSLVKLIAERSN